MTIVKELNELAEKIIGENPRATTDAQAMNYIEQNYNGGSSSGGNVVEKDIPTDFVQRYLSDPTKFNQQVTITNSDDLEFLSELENEVKSTNKAVVKLGLNGEYHYADYLIGENTFSVSITSFYTIMSNDILLRISVSHTDNFYIYIKAYQLTPLSLG